ncbi:hypothetical protein QJS10_CPA08g00412 [Acorus calamus]|uniref:Uncharacterized protein n=1 Tax=Acorus calamus TaxID=4465 RepID=A0AAV9E8T6_ACOCL|nr:hypothetical protein QJS10_CPA08g00412 [Acorus calamus]
MVSHTVKVFSSGEYSVRVYNDDIVVEMPILSNDNQLGTWVSNIRAIWGWDDPYLLFGSSIKAFGIVSVPQEHIEAIYEQCAANGRCGRDVDRSIAGLSHPTVDVNRIRPSDAMDP